jgi:hypothetical protein
MALNHKHALMHAHTHSHARAHTRPCFGLAGTLSPTRLAYYSNISGGSVGAAGQSLIEKSNGVNFYGQSPLPLLMVTAARR